MAKQDNKTPQEASNIFHSIMKASVKPAKKEVDTEELKDVKPKTKK
jgi:hypothetical protein